MHRPSSVSVNLETNRRNVRKPRGQRNLPGNLRKILFSGLVRPQRSTGLTHHDIQLPDPPFPHHLINCPYQWQAKQDPWDGGSGGGCRPPVSQFHPSGSPACVPFHKQAKGQSSRMWEEAGQGECVMSEDQTKEQFSSHIKQKVVQNSLDLFIKE